MKSWLIILLIISSAISVEAQKINPEKWVSHTVDSLRHKKIDTIEYYHTYCGGCSVSRNPNDTLRRHSCEVGTGWSQINSTIIYKQDNNYYSLTFNCGYPPIKKQLLNCESLSYFSSIVPVLDDRDKAYKALRKQRGVFFLPPMVTDGKYVEANIYLPTMRQDVFMQERQKTDTAWRSFFWIDKQTKLLSLLEYETSPKSKVPPSGG